MKKQYFQPQIHVLATAETDELMATVSGTMVGTNEKGEVSEVGVGGSYGGGTLFSRRQSVWDEED